MPEKDNKLKGKYSFFTSKEIHPNGWLKKQLEIQAQGLVGNLDRVWPDIRDSAWIGGSCEGWERVPYWLDGFIPMAFLLDSEELIGRARRYIDAILANQKEDGWICPNGDTPIEKYDTWAVQLISKTLTVWYDCSGDERIPDALYRLMKNYYGLLSSGRIVLFSWGKSRWFEACVALKRLSELFPGEEWINSLAGILRAQGLDWSAQTELWKEPLNKWTHETHIVNLGMMLKYEAVSHGLLGEPYTDKAEELYKILKKYNGTAVGIFTGDECLAGISPIRGTELCSVVELMYSMEWLYAETGDRKWAERLEEIAFNALPATVSEDMWTHQYDQMSNQIDCTPFRGNPVFGTNGKEAHVFGLEPNYGCCTANMGQGFPKFCLSAFMKSEKGIINAFPLPSTLKTNWKGANIRIDCVTEYPFRNTVTYRISSDRETDMKFTFRIPSFAKAVSLNSFPVQGMKQITLDGFTAGISMFVLDFETVPQLMTSPSRLHYVKCGSLIFSLPVREEWTPVEYTKKGVERKAPYCDYRLEGKSAWNYAFSGDTFTKNYRQGGTVPFSATEPRVTVTASVVPIDWGFEPKFDTVCRAKPKSSKPAGEVQQTELIPYGCARLRMTELPTASK